MQAPRVHFQLERYKTDGGRRSMRCAVASGMRERLVDFRTEARDASQHRHKQHMRVGQARRGIPRHRKHRFSLRRCRARRLARFHGDAVKEQRASRGDRIANQIALADGTASRKHDDIVRDEARRAWREARRAYREREDTRPGCRRFPTTTAESVNRLMS